MAKVNRSGAKPYMFDGRLLSYVEVACIDVCKYKSERHFDSNYDA